MTLALDAVTDADWDRGASRTSAAIRLLDPVTALMIREGTSLSLPDGSFVRVAATGVDSGVIELAKKLPPTAFDGFERTVTADVAELDAGLYHSWLFERAFGQADLGYLPGSWGHSLGDMQGLVKRDALDTQVRLDPTSPALAIPLPADLSSGSEVDMVAFNVSCEGVGLPILSLSWTSRQLSFQGAPGRTFVADPGMQLVPLDSSAFWRSTRAAEDLTISLLDPAGCTTVEITDVSLWQRGDQFMSP